MPARFDDLIPFSGDTVIAVGPLHPTETVKEVCAWVYQESRNGKGDAAATEMTTQQTGKDAFQQVAGKRWLLALKQVSGTPLREGRGFAVAVALIGTSSTTNGERVVWWGQPVDLRESADDVAAAQQPDALTRPPLDKPAPFDLPASA